MNILDLLENEQTIFSTDGLDNKKVLKLVEKTNSDYINMSKGIKNFREFASSQLQGEYNQKIIKVKSLVNYFDNWQGIQEAFNQIKLEEDNQIQIYNNLKQELLNSLRELLETTKKEFAISKYDLLDDNYVLCEQGHEVVIVGEHHTYIIEKMIEVFEQNLLVNGNFDSIQGVELTANYEKVYYNVNLCLNKINELFSSKPHKLEKFTQIVNEMENVGFLVVFFETYRKDLEIVGCSQKSMQEYEKAFTKKYIPIKKTLQKVLKISLTDICDIVVDENEYSTTEYDYLNENENSDQNNNDVAQNNYNDINQNIQTQNNIETNETISSQDENSPQLSNNIIQQQIEDTTEQNNLNEQPDYNQNLNSQNINNNLQSENQNNNNPDSNPNGIKDINNF